MAKKKFIPTLADPGDDPRERDNRSPSEKLQEQQEQQIVELIKKAQMDDGLVALRRRAVNETEFGHLAEMSAAVFSEENVRKIYGGGDYKAQFKTAAGKFVGNASFKIDYSIPAKYPGHAARPDGEEKPADNTAAIVTAVAAAVKQSLPPPAPPQDNALFLELIRQQGATMTALMSKPAPVADNGLAAAVAEMRAELRALRDGAGSRGDSFQKTLENARTLIELTGGNGGGGDSAPPEKPDRVSELIRALAPAVAPFVARMMNGPGAPPDSAAGTRPMLTAAHEPILDPMAQTPNPSAAQPADDMNVLFSLFLPQFRQMALIAAAKGRDAFEWADNKLDEIDPKYHDAIFQLANSEGWFTKIFGDDPAADGKKAWILDMRNAILVRAFVADVKKRGTALPVVEPAAYAVDFLDRASPSFYDTLWNLLDPEEWAATFVHDAEKIPVEWLEAVRVALEKQLSDDEPEAPAAAPAAPAAPAADQGPKDQGTKGPAPAPRPTTPEPTRGSGGPSPRPVSRAASKPARRDPKKKTAKRGK